MILDNFNSCIEQFYKNQKTLRETLDVLEDIIREFPVSKEAKSSLLDTWDIMEEVYAIAASNNRLSLNEAEASIIFKTLEKIKKQSYELLCK